MKRTNVKPFALDIRAMICLAAYADGTAKETNAWKGGKLSWFLSASIFLPSFAQQYG